MTPLSKAKISLIKSLSIKKFRLQHSLFIAEGEKIVDELIESDFSIKYIIHTDKWSNNIPLRNVEIIKVTYFEIERITNLKTSPNVIAIVDIPKNNINITSLKHKLTLAIDDIQDPGNLGTLIRICDWFGIENIICSQNSVDLYNPKVIQATMGSFLRVNVHYVDLPKFIYEYKNITKNMCYGTFLDGENLYRCEKREHSLIIFGNESKGISKEIESIVDKKLFIPPFNVTQHSESLNISIAGAIVCSEFRRM